MSGPFELPFYQERIKRYSRVLGSVIAALQVNTQGKLIRLPLEYLGGLRDISSPTYTAGILPVMTLKFSGFQVDSEKTLNRNLKVVYGSALQLQRLPVKLDFEWCIRVKKQDEMFQIFEQVVCGLYPTLDVLVNSDDITVQEENVKIVPAAYEFMENFDGDMSEGVSYDITFMITIEGAYFYNRTLNGAGSGGNDGLIHEVVVNVSSSHKTPFSDSQPWFNVYDNFQTTERFHAQQPLGPDEGAYHYNNLPDPQFFEVIGSGDWTRNGYE